MVNVHSNLKKRGEKLAKRGPKKGSKHHHGMVSLKHLASLKRKFIKDCNTLKRDGLRGFAKARKVR